MGIDMEKLQLLSSEAVIFEGLKAGKSVAQISKEIGDNKGHTNSRVKRMLELGFISREGQPKRFVYSVSNKPYEIIQIRKNEKVVITEEDTLVTGMVGFALSEDKIQFLKDNYQTMTRSQLCRKLGIAKLELNHVIHTLGLKQKEVKPSKVDEFEIVIRNWREAYQRAWRKDPPEIEFVNGWFSIQGAKYRRNQIVELTENLKSKESK